MIDNPNVSILPPEPNFIVQSEIISTLVYTDPALSSEHSRRQYRSNVERFETWRNGRELTRSLVEEYAAHLQREGYAYRTQMQKLSSVLWWTKKLIEHMQDHSNLPDEEIERLGKKYARVLEIKLHRIVKGDDSLVPTGTHIKYTDQKRLLKVCVEDQTPAGVRDAALYALSIMTGARISEYTLLQVSDLTILGEDEAELLLHGKGAKDRVVAIYNGTLAYLQKWLELRGESNGPIFCQIRKDGTILPDRGMTTEGMRKIDKKRFKQAHLRGITHHDFRRSVGGNLLDANVDIATVAEVLGHRNVQTTRGYDRRPIEVRRAAMRKLRLPVLEPKEGGNHEQPEPS